MYSVLRLVPLAAALAAVVALSPSVAAISPEAAEVQLQLARLLFNDGRYVESFNAFEQVKSSDDPRIKRESLIGAVKTALRLGDFSHAYADGQILARAFPRNPDAIANYGDALWAVGLFEASEKTFQDVLSLQKGSRPGAARPRAQSGRAQPAERGARYRPSRPSPKIRATPNSTTRLGRCTSA
jgi:tetratricopeptide (TPR) repeat protein